MRKGALKIGWVIVEVVAGLTAFIALYDFLFAAKTVPYLAKESSACISDGTSGSDLALREFLTENIGRYVFLDLRFDVSSEAGFGSTDDPCYHDGHSFGVSLAPDAVSERPERLEIVDAKSAASILGLYVYKRLDASNTTPFSTFNISEDFTNGVMLHGIYFAEGSYGEGTYDVRLHPAPLQPTTEKMYRCTPALKQSSWWRIPGDYFRDCLF